MYDGAMMKLEIHDSVVELVQGDITEMDTDAIVNAANAQLILTELTRLEAQRRSK
jgi:hypothetical protein